MNFNLNILPKLKIPIVAIMIIFCLYAPKAYAAPVPDSFTTKSYETLPSNAMSDAAYGNGVYIAVGYYGAIIRSYDSEIWQNVKTSADINYFGVTNPSSFTFNGAAFGNGKFVAVGAEGVILTSPDGVMWSQSVSGVTTGFSSVEYLQFNGVSAFYATTQGRILKSTDGISWTPVIPTGLDPTKFLTEVTVGNGNTRLAVGDSEGYIYSTTDGTSWSRTRPNNPDGWGASGTNMLTWMNDRYFISDPNAYIWTSTDLQSFTLVGSPFKQSSSQTGNQMFTGFYDGTKYYLFGYQSPYGYGAVYTSADALSWTMQTFTNEFVTQNAVYINGKYLRLGNEGLQVSSNGSDWNYKWGGTFYEIVYDGTKYIAVGAEKSEGAIWTSTDMANWSKSPLSSYVKSFNSVAFGNGKYVAIGGLTGTNTSLANSINGTDWTVKTTINDSSSFTDIAFGNGKFVAVGSNSSTGPVIKTSTDGSTWSAPSLPASSIDALYSVTYVNSQFIALGYGNNSTTGAVDSLSIWTSSDGETWVDKTSSYPNMTDVLNNIIYDGSKYILLGYDSTTYEMFSRSSADLITWSDATVMTGAYTLYGSSAQIAQKGTNIYVLVTDYDWNPVVYFTSDQGQTWQNAAISDLTGKAPYALMPVNNQIVIAGDSKLVMTTVVVDYPPAITSQPQEQAKIVGENASFSVTATGTELTYQWQVNTGAGFEDIIDNSIYSGATTDSLVITGTTILMNGYKYRVVVSGKVLPQAISEEAYLTVEKKDITGISFNNLTTTYDGSAKTIQLSGTLPTGVGVAYINNTQTNAGTYIAVVTIIGGTEYKDTTFNAVLTIEKAMLTATVGDYSKTYGDENPAFSVNVTGFVNGESPATAAGYIAPTAGSSALASTGAGTAGIVISGGDATNYSFNISDTGILTINKKILSATAAANDKVYDGTITETGSISLEGILYSDDVTVTGTFEFVDGNAGAGKTVNVTNITLGGAKAGNYSVNESTTTNADIAKADLSGIGFSDLTVTYDGTVKTVQLSGTLPVGASVAYSNNTGTNVGTYSAMATITGGTNYNDKVLNAILIIEKADLSGISFSDLTDTYDGSEKAVQISGALPAGTSVAYSNNTGTNAGTYAATATVSGGANYNDIVLNATLTIEKADISGISFTDLTTAYDGSEKTIQISGTLPAGASIVYSNNTGTSVGTYIATATITGGINYNDKVLNATLTIGKADITGISFTDLTTAYDGSEKTIQISGTLPAGASVVYSNNTGTNAGTYTATATITGGADYSDKVLNATLTIEKAILTATVGDYSKTYGEGNPVFTVNVTGFVNGESPATAAGYIAPTAASSALASTGAGTESIVISGGAATDYSFNISDTGVLTINKKALTVTATANDKVYDGTKTAAGSIALDGTLFSDDVTATGNFEFTDAKASTGKTVNVTNIKLGGAKASNYNLNSSSVTAIANVTQQTVTANVYAYDKVFDNNTTATGYITLVGVIGSDDVTGSGNFAFEDSAVGMNKIVNVTDIKLSGADAGNYVLDNTTSTTNANISKEISSIAVTTLPEKTVYEYGEEFNPYGTVITVTYNDSSKSTVSLFDNMYTVANSPLIGDRLVSVSYLGKTTTFIISFNKATQSQPGAPVCIVAEGGIKVTSPVGENYEYSIDGGVNWQSEDTFINLTPGIEYTITARLKETTTHNESAASIGTKVTFLDIVKPNLTVLRATRTSDTEAVVNISTNESGKYYYEVVSTGTPAPEINTGIGGTDCQAGETEIRFNLTSGGKDIYIKVKDLAGNVSDTSKVEIPAYVMTNAEKALTDLNDLTWNVVKGSNTYTNSVTEDLNLTVTGAVYGTNISWVSSNPQILSITGKITRPAYSQGDVSVTVTASVYNGGAGYTKSFDLIVLKNLASTNADLNKATISSGTLDTEFSSNILSYNSSVNYSTRSITITPISADAFATVKINGNSLTGGSYTVELNTGNNLITIEVTAQDGITKKVYTINMYRSSGSSSGDNTSDNNSGSEQPQTPGSSDNGVDVLVNGKAESSGTANTTNEGELIKTTITVDPQKLVQRLEAAGNNPTVTIPLNTKSDIIVGELNGDMIRTMESKEAVLEIKTDTASYRLPSQEVNIDSISAQLGTNIELKDIKVQVEISKPTNEVVKVVEDTANKGNFSIVVPPLEFSVTCHYNDKKIEVSAFKAYVERLIAIPEGVDPNKITTGVVIDSDGSVRHVPTKVVVQDGKYYASINSLTNSTYSVIWNPIEFKDVDKHWAKEDVNDMGSRMVITGVGNDSFEPDRDITRAEFAAIIVRALGLKPVTGKVPFSDLSSTEWYVPYINTAYEYGIVSGYGDGNFGPSDKITREQAMTMIARVMKITELKVELNAKEIETLLAGFSDSDQSDEWAKESIAECIKAGVVNGKSNEIVAPKDNITRAEVAAIIRRLLQKSSLI